MGWKAQVFGLLGLNNTQVCFFALPDFPLVKAGDDLVGLILAGLTPFQAQDGDIIVIASKVVSKAENRYVDLRTITPSDEANTLAAQTQKDPRVVELVLQNSLAISRSAPNVLLVRHKLGFVSANAGIDASNVGADNPDTVLLLPENPDQSAQNLRQRLSQALGIRLGVIISDTHGRPFRHGNIGVALGSAGIPALVDQRGEHDLFGYELKATITPLADEIASAAGLITGQANEGQPVVLVRGIHWADSPQNAQVLIRTPQQDLYA